ncbi:MAG: aldo/keto reductase [Clostridiales bacterium]|nr:aldo/keto reductase [Clostridiales bacterium]
MSNQAYVTLNNGVQMPLVGIGTFLLTPDEAENSCISALKDGYRLIDTANAYVNEKAVGRAMKKSGVAREEIFLETKLWPSFYEEEDAVEKTRERLDTEYIDLLLIHQPAGNYIAGYKLMEKAYKAGKVKAIGLSNFTADQVKEILAVCEVKPAILQTEVHPYSQEKELKEFLNKEGIVIQAWFPLGHGDKALRQESVFSELAEKYGKSNEQIILRWHTQAGNIVIPGSKNPDHIRANFEIFDFALTNEEMAKIAALNKDERYYHSTPNLLESYVKTVPPVDEQK